jgi:myo-inositol-1(or 4)-monophosphatase
MKIEFLRSIGETLAGEVRARSYDATATGIGAAGDKTFLIDMAAEEAIIAAFTALGKPVTIISEEIGEVNLNGGGEIVLIDPIDGSRNAVSGIPFFCTSIAIAEGRRLVDVRMSYIINLVNGDEFWAERGGGAFLNSGRIWTQEEDAFRLVSFESPSPGKDIHKLLPLLSVASKTRCLGATALDMAYLARGAISSFVSPSPSRSFDFAGGWLLVTEAGGTVTDIVGRDIKETPLDLKRHTTLLASGNGRLHEKALALLNRGRA